MKLKSLMKAALFLGALFCVTHANALDAKVVVTTHTPTASATDYSNGSYPNITGNLYLRQLILGNAGATAQDVTVYDTCTSSTAASIAMVINLPASIGTVSVPAHAPWLPQIFRLTSPCITKSSASSVVNATFFYE